MGRLIQGSQAVTATLRGQSSILCALRLGHAGGIVVAHRDGEAIVGSDLPALLPLFRHQSNDWREVGFLDSGEMAVITPQGASYSDLEGRPIAKQTRTISPEDVIIDKGGYRHFHVEGNHGAAPIGGQRHARAGGLPARPYLSARTFPCPLPKSKTCSGSSSSAAAPAFTPPRWVGT